MTHDLNKLKHYEETIEKVTVTYGDGSTKDFNANDWFLFEEGIRKIAKNIEIVGK